MYAASAPRSPSEGYSNRNSYSRNSNYSQPDSHLRTCSENSKSQQHLLVLLLLPASLIFLSACLVAIVMLAIHGPMLVPRQDTRVTSIVISASAKIATIIIGVVFLRSAWSSAVNDVVAGRPMSTKKLLATCRPFLSLGQLQYFGALPASFKLHVVLGALSLLAMVATSSSFRYDSLPTGGEMVALVPDVAFACPANLVEETGLFICDQGGSKLNILTNTSIHAWDYISEVTSGGQHTVTKYGDIGDESLGANVTIATLPAGWTLGPNNNLPWMAMWVSCEERAISVRSTGSEYQTNTSIYLDGKLAAIFDIGAMPQWNSGVHLLLRVNETGPFSSLGEYDVIMLGRDVQPNMRGVDVSTITSLGSAYLDLYGYGAVKQPLSGAGARCTFRAETGGQWQEGFWPPLNHTANTVWGEIVDDRPTLATAMLNYGASWQYTIVSDNDIPGGSVSYIANNTGPDVSFPHLLASYIRNQWTLMAYAISRHTYFKLEQPFVGSGPDKLFISVTLVAIVPGTALALSILVTARACIAVIPQRYWVNRVEFESWWLLKACRPDLYRAGCGNATEDKFMEAGRDISIQYVDVRPGDIVGQLLLRRSGGESEAFKSNRVYM
ncbi:hypothetical protein QBC42DRAFT_185667 [Cladorrhinum samala]|uniref:Uncharacterized protein n=1 Tax=Cladorrhinum samala TaxID=585594 RepID=A0AAV9HCS2_9PEZI|nr:hypothetical protein QBC42DRAFT_185667 [Cladorrhinum samala]